MVGYILSLFWNHPNATVSSSILIYSFPRHHFSHFKCEKLKVPRTDRVNEGFLSNTSFSIYIKASNKSSSLAFVKLSYMKPGLWRFDISLYISHYFFSVLLIFNFSRGMKLCTHNAMRTSFLIYREQCFLFFTSKKWF